MARLTDDEFFQLDGLYSFGETQEEVLMELDDQQFVRVSYLARRLDRITGSMVGKVKRMARYGFVDLRKNGKGEWIVRLPQQWPEPRAREEA